MKCDKNKNDDDDHDDDDKILKQLLQSWFFLIDR